MKKIGGALILIVFLVILGAGAAFALDSWKNTSKNDKKEEVSQEEDQFSENKKEEQKAKDEKEKRRIEEQNKKEEKKEESNPEKKEEKKEKLEEKEKKKQSEKEEQKEKKEEKILLDKAKRTGKYWVMLDFEAAEKEDYFEVKGSVYDAEIFSAWVDEIGSAGLEEGEEANGRDGLYGKNITLRIPKSLKVEAQKVEGFEIDEKSLKEFFDGRYGTFLFDHEGNEITKILDWYMNYSG